MSADSAADADAVADAAEAARVHRALAGEHSAGLVLPVRSGEYLLYARRNRSLCRRKPHRQMCHH